MLAFIGFIALLIFGKFLYDTYVTGKTDKDWDSFKKNEPEKAARIMNNSVTDMSTDYKYNPLHQKESLQVLATVFECEVSEVAEAYKAIQRKALASGLGTVEQFKQAMKDLKQEKYKQAIKMGFDPDNTPAAFMERWMQEVLDGLSKPKISVEDFLMKAAVLTSRNQHKDAISILAKGVKMIESGALSDNDNLKPYLFNFIGENFLMMKDFRSAYISFEQAINQLTKTNPDNKVALSKFLRNKHEAGEAGMLNPVSEFDIDGAITIMTDINELMMKEALRSKAENEMLALLKAAAAKPSNPKKDDVIDPQDEPIMIELNKEVVKAELKTKLSASERLAAFMAKTVITPDGVIKTADASKGQEQEVGPAASAKPKMLDEQKRELFEAGDEVNL